MFYLTTHSTHFIYGYMTSDIQIAREETCCRQHMDYSFRLAASDILYAPSHRQDSLCYTSRGALAGTRNNYSERERNLAAALCFSISSKGYFIYTNLQTEQQIPYTFVTPVVEHWLEREIIIARERESSLLRYVFRSAVRVILYTSTYRQNSRYHIPLLHQV